MLCLAGCVRLFWPCVEQVRRFRIRLASGQVWTGLGVRVLVCLDMWNH